MLLSSNYSEIEDLPDCILSLLRAKNQENSIINDLLIFEAQLIRVINTEINNIFNLC